MAANSYPDLLERLFGLFEANHTLVAIEDVIQGCRDELHGQIPAEARFELLERLARQRLTELAPTRR